MLETVDLSASLDEDDFKQRKEALHNEVRRAQLLAWKHKLGVIIVLEGWAFSGRVSVIVAIPSVTVIRTWRAL